MGEDHTLMAEALARHATDRDQNFLFSAPLQDSQREVQHKNRVEGFSLPESLARSLDSSEIDMINNAIVRVNKYGSSKTIGRCQDLESFQHCLSKKTTVKVVPSVQAFTVQCAKCFKWRIIPSKEQYEQIRQDIIENPFFCTSLRPGASCADPPELAQDAKLLWAIDKPSIPLTPNGWRRLFVIRGSHSRTFGDIYYVTPTGKRLRSMTEIERFLSQHPELLEGGLSLSQFSFSTPKALGEKYCRKRTHHSSIAIGSRYLQSNNLRVSGIRQSHHDQLFPTSVGNASLASGPISTCNSYHCPLIAASQTRELEDTSC
ncbi:hypothetical protein KP509_32G068800 [Ceratopteris richardii]|nr:hypothetical protein KP509_32G068800 [Ceratopteris richardii]